VNWLLSTIGVEFAIGETGSLDVRDQADVSLPAMDWLVVAETHGIAHGLWFALGAIACWGYW
jgi:hypothetical protein